VYQATVVLDDNLYFNGTVVMLSNQTIVVIPNVSLNASACNPFSAGRVSCFTPSSPSISTPSDE
jgi:hypothetical protein